MLARVRSPNIGRKWNEEKAPVPTFHFFERIQIRLKPCNETLIHRGHNADPIPSSSRTSQRRKYQLFPLMSCNFVGTHLLTPVRRTQIMKTLDDVVCFPRADDNSVREIDCGNHDFWYSEKNTPTQNSLPSPTSSRGLQESDFRFA